jgi:hypothetical protein
MFSDEENQEGDEFDMLDDDASNDDMFGSCDSDEE